ncbi:unnamed protein product [Diabrotica balteata]|uniref:Uncharacterized protein n=1 Tax=Diabrotica balteata TaxID=107213 RepID=A0A9N9XC29_DIABA|nr:unnamed protein product [Diabrotica balteata]
MLFACYNRIQRRLGPIEEWSEEEFNELEAALMELGYNWQLIGERLNKPPQTVKIYVAANRKKLKKCLGEDRKPALSTDEESGSSTSSCEENLIDGDRHSSDTASAAESPPVQSSNDSIIKKIDYDSSATETADEAQTPDQFQGAATITPVSNDGQPLSVKDLVLNVIEFSLMKNPGGQQTQNPPSSGMAPTISSILNNDSNEVTIVSEYNLNNINNQQRQQLQQRSDINLAKLVTPLIGATITPVSGPVQSQNQVESLQSSRDDLIVLQVPDGREPETLDLSLKKPRETLQPVHNKTQTQSQQQIHRDSYVYHQERKSSAFSVRSPTKMSTSKLANPKSGSITLGTPIMSQPRYEVLRQIPDTKMGSITQGTPVIPHNMQEKRVFDYFNKRGTVPVQQIQSSQQYSGQYRQAYNVEQQLSSRQIIINDYITSQQMLGRRNEKSQFYPTNSTHRTPSPSQPSQQQRQGVIQRNARPQYIQPGHEALSSLVDVAVQQPSLPVPNAHEGLGKTMADNILDQPHRYQIVHQQIRQHPQRAEEQRRSVCHQQQLQLQQPQQQLQESQKQQSHQHSQQSHQQPQQQKQTHLQSQPPQQTQVLQTQQQLMISQDQPKQDQQPQSVKQQEQQEQQQPEGENQDEKIQQSEQEEKEQEEVDQQKHQQKQPQLQNRQTSRSDNSTLTAASLIDAIITHQINQTAEGNREVVNNTREQRAGDLLFQKFHREEPASQNIQDNGEKSPLTINVDVDGDTLNKNLTVKELTDSVISHDFNARQPYYHIQENMNEQWKRRIQQHNEDKRSQTPLQDERHVIRITQPQQKSMEKMEPVSPPESNNWSEQNYRKYPTNQQSHMSPLDYVKNRIVEVMRTEDDNKKDLQEEAHSQEKDLSDSPGEMVIDEEKHENDFNQQQTSQHGGFYSFVHKETTASETSPNNEPKPLLSSQYEPLSDED